MLLLIAVIFIIFVVIGIFALAGAGIEMGGKSVLRRKAKKIITGQRYATVKQINRVINALSVHSMEEDRDLIESLRAIKRRKKEKLEE